MVSPARITPTKQRAFRFQISRSFHNNGFARELMSSSTFCYMSYPLRQLAIILFLGSSLHSLQASPGANVSWITYEAENMTNSGGTLIGPPVQVVDLNASVSNTIQMEAFFCHAAALT